MRGWREDVCVRDACESRNLSFFLHEFLVDGNFFFPDKAGRPKAGRRTPLLRTSAMNASDSPRLGFNYILYPPQLEIKTVGTTHCRSSAQRYLIRYHEPSVAGGHTYGRPANPLDLHERSRPCMSVAATVAAAAVVNLPISLPLLAPAPFPRLRSGAQFLLGSPSHHD